MRKTWKNGTIAALGVTMIMAACVGETPEQRVASAKQMMEKNDNAAAIIELKNALQSNSGLSEARFLLGKALFATGDLGGAAVELKRAADSGYTGEDLPVLFSQLYLQASQYDKLIAAYGQTKLQSPALMVKLQVALATAYGVLERNQDSRAAIDEALRLEPGNVQAQLIKVRLTASQEGLDKALAELSKMLDAHPESSESWQLKAEFLLRNHAKPEAVVEAYQQAISHDKNNVNAQIALAVLYKRMGRIDDMSKTMDALRVVAPDNLQLGLLSADYALIKGDVQSAFDQIQALMKVAPEDPSVLYLAGAIEFQRGNLLSAADALSKAVQHLTDSGAARVLLARVYLRTGESSNVVNVLQPLIEATPPSWLAYSLTAQAQLQAGDVKGAVVNFTRAAALNPKDVTSRAALAAAQIDQGHDVQGLDALRALSASDAGTVADLVMISAHMNKRRYDEALGAVDVLDRKQPGKSLAPYLRGQIELGRGNTVPARAAFEAALQADPVFYPAAMQLARLDVADKHIDAAIKRYQALLTANPGDVQAEMAVIALRQLQGVSGTELMEQMGAIIRKRPQLDAPRIALVRMQLQQGAAKTKVLATLQEAVAAVPNSAELQDLLGQALEDRGDSIQAEAAFNKAAALRPTEPEPYVQIANLYGQRGDSAMARQQLKRALAVKPDFDPALDALFGIDVATNHLDEIRELAASLRRAPTSEWRGLLLEGDLEAQQKNWGRAASAYRASLGQHSNMAAAVKLCAVLSANGKKDEAETVELAWMKSHPQDAAFLFALGDQALGRVDWADALVHFQQVLRITPDHPSANNNVAWLLHELKRPDALRFAEAANRLHPDEPAFLDTQAAIVADDGDLNKALVLQKHAVELSPKLYIHRLHLAQLYIRSGQKEQARKELSNLSDLGEKFSAQSDVQKLMSTL